MRARLARILLACLAVLVLVAVFAVVGCKSDTRRIAEGASEVTLLAGDTKDKLAQIIELLRPYAQQIGALVFALLDAARDNQDGIIGRAAEVQSAAAGVTDKVWAGWGAIKWGATALAVLGGCFLLWYTGVGFIVKRVLLAFGVLIPAKVRQAVDLDAEALEENPDAPAVRAAVAGKRGASPEYDAAWRKRKKRKAAVEAGLKA